MSQEPPSIIDTLAKMVNDILAGIAGTSPMKDFDFTPPKSGCGCQANKGQ